MLLHEAIGDARAEGRLKRMMESEASFQQGFTSDLRLEVRQSNDMVALCERVQHAVAAVLAAAGRP